MFATRTSETDRRRRTMSETAADARALLPGHGGNRVFSRHVARERRLARKPTLEQAAIALSLSGAVATDDDLTARVSAFVSAGATYANLDDAKQDGQDGLAALETMKTLGGDLEARLIRLREQTGDATTTSDLYRLKSAVVTLFNAANREHATLRRRLAGERYANQVEPNTMQALDQRTAKYLLISPRPGTEEAEARGGAEYPADLPVQQQMTLALPPRASAKAAINDIKSDGQAVGTLDVLVIAGSHGGVGALFEQDTGYGFGRDYWEQQIVKPLLNRVRAHYIVLDACLTASMIDVFRPLLTGRGRIVCSMYSVNGQFVTPQLWHQLIGEATGPGTTVDRVGPLLQGRFDEFKLQAPRNTASALFGRIQSGEPQELEQMIQREPSTEPLISRLRHLPKLHEAIAGWLAGTETHAVASTKLSEVLAGRPTPADHELELGATLMSLISDDQPGTKTAAADHLRAALQALTHTDDQDLTLLLTSVRDSTRTGMHQDPASQAPTHLACFDQASNTLHFDQLVDTKEGRDRVTLSTASESIREMDQLRRHVDQLGVQLSKLPVDQLKL